MSDKRSEKKPDNKGGEKGLLRRLISRIKRFFQSFSFIIFIYLMIFTIAPVTIVNILDRYYFGNIIQETELAGMQTQTAVLTDDVRKYETLDEVRTAGIFKNYS